MKRSYLIVPGILLGAFGLYHQYDDIGRQAAAEKQATKLAADKLADDAKKARVKVEVDTRNQQLTEERAQAECNRIDKKRRDFEAAIAQLAAETTAHAAEVQKLEGEAATTAQHLADLHAAMAKSERANSDLAKLVEERRIERRNADLEIQRAVRLLATRLDTLTLAGGGNGAVSIAPRTP
jgi:chromosome segregation ATPase